jgi:aromatic ring hydroxylase
VVPSSNRDLQNPELRPLIERYYRGSDSTAEERIKLFKLIWDAIGTEFGGRHELYERNYSGNNEQIRLDLANFATVTKQLDRSKTFVDECLAEYDVNGWTAPTWNFGTE